MSILPQPYRRSFTKPRLLSEEEHVDTAFILIKHALLAGELVLTKGAVQELLNLRCVCCKRHSSKFVRKCIKRVNEYPTISLQRQTLYSFGVDDVVRFASFVRLRSQDASSLSNIASSNAKIFPLSETIKSEIQRAFWYSNTRVCNKMIVSDTKSVAIAERPQLWMEVTTVEHFGLHQEEMDWATMSESVLASMVCVKLQKAFLHPREQDNLNVLYKGDIFREAYRKKLFACTLDEKNNDGPFSIGVICKFDPNGCKEGLEWLLNNFGTDQENPKSCESCIIHLYCLRETIEAGGPLSFEIGSVFSVDSN